MKSIATLVLASQTNAFRIHGREYIGLGDNGLIGNDDIGKATNDDMYAFSQVVANGGGVTTALAELEEGAKILKQKEKEKD